MRHAAETERLFNKIVDETPQEIKTQMDWQFGLADIIYNRLQEIGMSKKELAQKVGTSPAAVSRWVGGGHNITLTTLAKITSVLGVPLISVASK